MRRAGKFILPRLGATLTPALDVRFPGVSALPRGRGHRASHSAAASVPGGRGSRALWMAGFVQVPVAGATECHDRTWKRENTARVAAAGAPAFPATRREAGFPCPTHGHTRRGD